MMILPHHYESHARLQAPASSIFAYLDDHERLSAHMTRSSWMMGGGRMSIDFDQDGGRSVGSRIGIAGRIFGVELSLDEIVRERVPPSRKVWETTGTPRLLVIAHYRMGFDIVNRGDESLLSVFIDYALPRGGPQSLLGRILGGYYAHWCVDRMVRDAVKHFSKKGERI